MQVFRNDEEIIKLVEQIHEVFDDVSINIIEDAIGKDYFYFLANTDEIDS